MATQVYERGVAATPYSADLWVNYAAFRKSQPGATAEELRRCELIWFGLPTTTSHSRLTCPASADCCCWGLGLGTGGGGEATDQPAACACIPAPVSVPPLPPLTCIPSPLPVTTLPPSLTCSIYERGVAYCGTDFNAHGLWDKYLALEQEQGSGLHLASLYTRIMGCPIKELDKYYTK